MIIIIIIIIIIYIYILYKHTCTHMIITHVDYLTAIEINISIFRIYKRQNVNTGTNFVRNLPLQANISEVRVLFRIEFLLAQRF